MIRVWLARLLDRWGFVDFSNRVYRSHSRIEARKARARLVLLTAAANRAKRRLELKR
jgi:hypothetical protein